MTFHNRFITNLAAHKRIVGVIAARCDMIERVG